MDTVHRRQLSREQVCGAPGGCRTYACFVGFLTSIVSLLEAAIRNPYCYLPHGQQHQGCLPHGPRQCFLPYGSSSPARPNCRFDARRDLRDLRDPTNPKKQVVDRIHVVPKVRSELVGWHASGDFAFDWGLCNHGVCSQMVA
jgi:hypothetical protein